MNAVRLLQRRVRLSTAVCIASMACVHGCGAPATTITGVVTLDGKPVPSATLEFFPVSGKGRVSFTTTDASGRYQVAVWPTPLKVVVTAMQAGGKEKNFYDPNGPLVDRLVNVVPEQYGYQEKTPLVAEPVEGKTTTIDFAITLKAQ